MKYRLFNQFYSIIYTNKGFNRFHKISHQIGDINNKKKDKTKTRPASHELILSTTSPGFYVP